jgi:hypothetical protein
MAWFSRVVRGSPVLLLMWMLLSAGQGAAQEPGRVVGRITDGAGNPVRGATLVLVSDADSSRSTATSGETGGFEFARVAAGTYTLRAERPGFATRTTRVTVEPGERETVIARLRPARTVPTAALRQP